MATKGEGKTKKGEKRSAKKLEDALHNLGPSETPQPEESESTEKEAEQITEVATPKDPSPEPVYDEPTLSELIVTRFVQLFSSPFTATLFPTKIGQYGEI